MKKQNIYFLASVIFLYSGIFIQMNHTETEIIKDDKDNILYIPDSGKESRIKNLGYFHITIAFIFISSGIKEIRRNRKEKIESNNEKL